MHIDGKCHCGAISFTAEVDPSRVMVCHCADCQILSGSPMRAVVAAPMATFVVRGRPKRYVKVAQSGNLRAQVFCPECGTPLYATAPENATSVIIRVASRNVLSSSLPPRYGSARRCPGSTAFRPFPARPSSRISCRRDLEGRWLVTERERMRRPT